MDSGFEVVCLENEKEEENNNLEISQNFHGRKLSQLSMNALIQKDRNKGLANIRTIINDALTEDDIEETKIEIMLKNQEFCQALFHLFDAKTVGVLNLSTWIANLRYWSKVNWTTLGQAGAELGQAQVELEDIVKVDIGVKVPIEFTLD